MSLTDDYLKARNKRVESETPKTNDPLTSDYLRARSYRRENGVGINGSSFVNYNGFNSNGFGLSSLGDIAPVKKKRTWFDTGAFDDGYDFGDISKVLLGTLRDVNDNLFTGVVGMGEKAIDAAVGVAPILIPSLKDSAEEFIKKDLYDEEKVGEFLGKFSAPGMIGELLGVDADKDSLLGEKSDSVVQSAGQLLGQIGLQAVHVPWFVTSGVTSFGSEMENALNEGATLGEAQLSSAITAGAEILTEMISGGVKFGGKALDDVLVTRLSRGVSNKFVRNLLKWGLDTTGEGFEEVLTEGISKFGQWLTYQDDNTLSEMLFSEQAMDEYLEAFIGGAAIGGGMSTINAVRAGASGADAVSGLTDTEKAVVDAEFESRIDGKKLTEAQKDEIYESVIKDLERGDISIDTIERVLGGETYQNYRSTVDSEDAILKEYEDLGAKENPTLADQSRYTELTAQVRDIRTNSTRSQLESQVHNETFGLVKDTRLAESYYERSRRGQAFEADVSKYDAKQRDTIQKAIDSGILNNTRRTHEFVDMISKISADKGVLFDFTNNTKLKESGFAIEGKQVNGFVTKDGITLNIDSPKALQTTVGHEVTHILEGTELYNEFQKVLFNYAESKGELGSRRSALEALYKGVDGANIDAELTADLVGEYIFTDDGFIKNLSAKNRNVFQKIYDELMYLYKVATAGSKEARELEKVKRAFESAYREAGKAQTDTKYSISDSTGKQLTAEQQEYFKDSKARDENGNLKVVYHSSPTAGFTVFDGTEGKGNYKFGEYGDSVTFFTDNKAMADSYSPSDEKVDTKKLNNLSDAREWLGDISAGYVEIRDNNGVLEVFDSDDGSTILEYDSEEELLRNLKRDMQEELGNPYAGGQYEGYLNLKKPLVVDAEGRPWNRVTDEFSQEVYDKFQSLTEEERALLIDLAEWEDFSLFVKELEQSAALYDMGRESDYTRLCVNIIDKLGVGDSTSYYNLFDVAADAFAEETVREKSVVQLSTNDYVERALRDGSYDGVIIKNVIDYGGHAHSTLNSPPGNDYIIFNSNQFKAADNLNPTEDADIRYSLSADSEGRTLSAAVAKRFENSRVVDENGSLKVVYHGTASGEFSIFDKAKGSVEGDFGSGFYFTDNEADVSEHYEGGGPDFENKVARLAEQIESDEDIDYEEAEERARVELYKGSHKFEVYLNIENPAIVGETMLFDSDFGDRYNEEDFDDYDEYIAETEQAIADAVDEIVWEVEKNVDLYSTDGLAGVIYEAYYNGGIDIEDLKHKLNELYLEDSNGNLVANEVARQIIESLGYDGIIDPTVSSKWNMDIEEGTTHYIVFKPNQIKAVTNQSPTDNPDIHRSLSPAGGQAVRPNHRAIMGEDIALEVAPTAEDSTGVSEMETTTPIASKTETVEDMFPDDGSSPEMDIANLTDRRDAIEQELQSMIESGSEMDEAWQSEYTRLSEEWQSIDDRIKELESEVVGSDSERIGSLADSDAPPEIDAPYYGESQDVTVDNPFEDRDWYGVSKRNVKAYMYENPEVKPFFQEEAMALLGELNDTTKGERIYSDDVYYRSGGEKGWGGVKRHTSESIETLLDSWHMTYADIEKGLNAIIEDNGAENIAAAKKIEFMLNDRLLRGYKDFYSNGRIEPNQEYINLLTERQINAYSREAFDSLMQNADDYAPEEIAPVKPLAKATPDTLDTPIFESRDKNAVKGQTTMFAPEKPAQKTSGKTANILVNEPKTPKRRSKFWSLVKDKVLDKGMVFEDYAKETGNREIEAKWNFIRYSQSRAQRLIGNGTEGVKSLKDIKKTVDKSGKTEEFYNYLYHKHNVDRMSLEDRYDNTPNKAVFGDSVTSEMSQRVVERYERRNPEFLSWAEDVYGYMNHLRNLLVENEVISQETADLWGEMYPHYVPIRRAGVEGANINVPLDSRRTTVNNPVKRATGGNQDILPLFDTMAQRTAQTYRAIARNSFGIELKNQLGTVVEKNAPTVDDVIDGLEQDDALLKPGGFGSNPTFAVFENGERVDFEITEEMYEAMKPTSEALQYRNKILAGASSVFRGLTTQYSIPFMATNAIKDAQDVLINSQHPGKTYANFPRAWWQQATGGKYYREYIENGGEDNSYFDNETNTFKEDNGFMKAVKLPLTAISTANNFIELTPRLAEYIASREAGRSVEVSMLDAARVTTNFAAGGDLTKFLNRNGVTFLNASVQGAVQQMRNIREAHQKGFMGYMGLAARFTLAGLPAVLLNNMLWDDDEEYEELADYVKQDYYIVGKYDDGKFIRIPKGRTVAVIQNAMEQIMNAATGDGEVDLKNFLTLAVNNLAPNNPLENNILAPLMQAATNKTWYGEDLVPARLQKLPSAEQFDEKTDHFSKWLGETDLAKALNISPYQINYVLNQYSGGLGDLILPMLTPRAESGDDSLWGAMTAPLRDKFTTDSVINSQTVSDFYDTQDALERNANSKDATELDAFKYMYMRSVGFETSDLYARKREIQSSDLPDSEKYELVREIQAEINAMMEEALSSYNDPHIDGLYAEVGSKRFNYDSESGNWYEIKPTKADGTDNWFYQKEQEVTQALGISYGEYWNNRDEYNFAYDKPGKYAIAQAVGGYDSYQGYSDALYDIHADKDENGKSINGSRKTKVIDYIDGLDCDYGMKLILFKSEYNADDRYNYDIIEYLNEREDISYQEMETILKELGFNVDSNGHVTW